MLKHSFLQTYSSLPLDRLSKLLPSELPQFLISRHVLYSNLFHKTVSLYQILSLIDIDLIASARMVNRVMS